MLDARDVADCGRLDADPGRELAAMMNVSRRTLNCAAALRQKNKRKRVVAAAHAPLCGLWLDGAESIAAAGCLVVDPTMLASAAASSITCG